MVGHGTASRENCISSLFKKRKAARCWAEKGDASLTNDGQGIKRQLGDCCLVRQMAERGRQ